MCLTPVFALLCLVPPDPSDGGLPRSLSEPVQEGAAATEAPRFTIGVHGRLVYPDGTITNPDYAFVQEVDFSDLFEDGEGIRLELGLLWTLDADWSLGAYLVIGVDSFEGKTFVDNVGDEIKTRNMDARSFLIGFRGVYGGSDGPFVDLRTALGLVSWEDVRADFTVGGTSYPGISFFEATSQFAFELGVRVGYRAGIVAFTFGLGMTVSGGPERGSDVTDVIDPSSVLSVALELGIELIF